MKYISTSFDLMGLWKGVNSEVNYLSKNWLTLYRQQSGRRKEETKVTVQTAQTPWRQGEVKISSSVLVSPEQQQLCLHQLINPIRWLYSPTPFLIVHRCVALIYLMTFWLLGACELNSLYMGNCPHTRCWPKYPNRIHVHLRGNLCIGRRGYF